MKWEYELKLAKEAASAASDILKSTKAGFEIVDRAGKDIKLRADKESEEAIIKILSQNSTYSILSEECGESEVFNTDSPYWIVDPLDGTANYSRNIPINCISIALWQGEIPILGVIYDFHNDEMFFGVVNDGAWCNEKEISVSDVKRENEAILTTGFPINRCYNSEALSDFLSDIQSFKKIRMFGSAAMSLAYLASGRVDAYTEEDIMLWDTAAGIAIVKAAGGWVEVEGSKTKKWARNVKCASSASIFEKDVR